MVASYRRRSGLSEVVGSREREKEKGRLRKRERENVSIAKP